MVGTFVDRPRVASAPCRPEASFEASGARTVRGSTVQSPPCCHMVACCTVTTQVHTVQIAYFASARRLNTVADRLVVGRTGRGHFASALLGRGHPGSLPNRCRRSSCAWRMTLAWSTLSTWIVVAESVHQTVTGTTPLKPTWLEVVKHSRVFGRARVPDVSAS